MSKNFKVVLDTNQIIGAGSRWLNEEKIELKPNSHREIVKLVAERHSGLYNPKMMGEYVEKLLAGKHPIERIQRYIGLLMGTFQLVQEVTSSPKPSCSDPDDEVFLICAIDGEADYLVSDDNDLLSLKGGYTNFKIIESKIAKPILNCEE